MINQDDISELDRMKIIHSSYVKVFKIWDLFIFLSLIWFEGGGSADGLLLIEMCICWDRLSLPNAFCKFCHFYQKSEQMVPGGGGLRCQF